MALPKKWPLVLLFFLLLATVIVLTSLLNRKLQPGNCLVLEQKYCRMGKAISRDGKLAFVGFKLPRGTFIFAPFDGSFSNASTFFVKKGEEYITYPGISVDVSSDAGRYPERSFTAAYYDLENRSEELIAVTRKGEVVGRVLEKVLTEYGDYNLLVSFSEFDQESKMFSPNEKELKRLFRL